MMNRRPLLEVTPWEVKAGGTTLVAPTLAVPFSNQARLNIPEEKQIAALLANLTPTKTTIPKEKRAAQYVPWWDQRTKANQENPKQLYEITNDLLAQNNSMGKKKAARWADTL